MLTATTNSISTNIIMANRQDPSNVSDRSDQASPPMPDRLFVSPLPTANRANRRGHSRSPLPAQHRSRDRSRSPLPARRSPNRRVLGSISNIQDVDEGGDCTEASPRTPGLLAPPMHANENLLVPRDLNIEAITSRSKHPINTSNVVVMKNPRQLLDHGAIRSPKHRNCHSTIVEESQPSQPWKSAISFKDPTDKLQGLRRTGRFCGAIIDDYKRRSSVYLSDFTDGFHSKSFSAFLYMFFATFASTVALGVVVDDVTSGTNKSMGVTELVLSLSIAGMVHSLFAGCSMVVLRPTGPITLFIIKLYGLAAVLKVDFFQWFSWVGLFVGVYMILIASFDHCRHITLATRFLHDMFSFFVCTIYIHDGVAGIIRLWPNNDQQVGAREHWQDEDCQNVACAYFSIILFCITLLGALFLNNSSSTTLLNAKAREVVKDYALTIAVFVAILIGYASSAAQEYQTGEANQSNEDYIPHVSLPQGIVPTFNNVPEHNHTSRAWWIGLTLKRANTEYSDGTLHVQRRALYDNTTIANADVCGNDSHCNITGLDIVFAALAAIPITLWFYFDQLFSCLLTQVAQGPHGNNLVKGSYYHSSFLWVGICNLVLPMFGLPFVTASLPHSPQFVRALQIRDPKTGQVTSVIDNRVAPFFMYLFCGLALILPGTHDKNVLELIPKGVVYGILTFVGVAGVLPEAGNEFSKRLLLFITAPSEFPKSETFTQVSVTKMHAYTTLQVLALVICWMITVSNTFGDNEFWHYLGLFFPLWIVALIPIRRHLLVRCFTESELKENLDRTEDFVQPPHDQQQHHQQQPHHHQQHHHQQQHHEQTENSTTTITTNNISFDSALHKHTNCNNNATHHSNHNNHNNHNNHTTVCNPDQTLGSANV